MVMCNVSMICYVLSRYLSKSSPSLITPNNIKSESNFLYLSITFSPINHFDEMSYGDRLSPEKYRRLLSQKNVQYTDRDKQVLHRRSYG